MGVLIESWFPRVASLKRCCGFLSSGAQHMLPQSYPNYKTVHRRFQSWCRDEVLRRVLTDVANELRDRGTLDEEECFIDATFVARPLGACRSGLAASACPRSRQSICAASGRRPATSFRCRSPPQ
jgi:hypothetical protein